MNPNCPGNKMVLGDCHFWVRSQEGGKLRQGACKAA